MKLRNSGALLGLLVLLLISFSAQAATTVRGTPVTVMNDPTQAVPVTGTISMSTPSTLYKPVGVTTQKVGAGASNYKYNAACSAEFVGSRMCTSEEILKSTNKIAFTGPGIINPTIIAILPSNSAETVELLDISGMKGTWYYLYGNGSHLSYSGPPNDDIGFFPNGPAAYTVCCCAP